ncbi:PilZ domain-containing protein [Sphingomonas sp. KRR8]|uniref:PilZ domain-containing protein n=1 Tax=Sphingomonas sp. KRR8 TaxID=2942996 RepID=UPI0020208A08|nr:PilZ domain-containing protein [Sphingomonas sp. KRR8]URD60410.1 PilZ domain-containing protein [Sphingomonas sp. KRR8]
MSILSRSRSARHPVRQRAQLFCGDGSTSAVDVENISNDGCCVYASLEVGAQLNVRVPGAAIVTAAQVCWSASGKSGLRFSCGSAPAGRQA